jgi:hypothetical protein
MGNLTFTSNHSLSLDQDNKSTCSFTSNNSTLLP